MARESFIARRVLARDSIPRENFRHKEFIKESPIIAYNSYPQLPVERAVLNRLGNMLT